MNPKETIKRYLPIVLKELIVNSKYIGLQIAANRPFTDNHLKIFKEVSNEVTNTIEYPDEGLSGINLPKLLKDELEKLIYGDMDVGYCVFTAGDIWNETLTYIKILEKQIESLNK